MQRSDTTVVQRVRIRADIDEEGDDLTLCITVPRLRARTPVGGVVQRFGSPSVRCSNVGTSRDERFGEFTLIRGSRHVQRRVAGVDVVTTSARKYVTGSCRLTPTRIGHRARSGEVSNHRATSRSSRKTIARNSAKSAPSSGPSSGPAVFATRTSNTIEGTVRDGCLRGMTGSILSRFV
jgi:hypothetical protein